MPRQHRTVLVDSPSALASAMRHLHNFSLYALDIEGIALSRTGPLTLIQICPLPSTLLMSRAPQNPHTPSTSSTSTSSSSTTSTATSTDSPSTQRMAEVDLFSDDSDTDSDDESWEDVVYLIDVAILGYDAFARSLKDILEDPGRIKLVFDCRSDADALYHQYGVRLQGVLDVQLLEVASRRAKGYQVLYNASLAKTMSRYGLWGAAEVERKASVHKLCGEVPDVWALRPLTQELVEYASADVARLGHLAQLMAFEVGPEWLLRVWHASQQYADMYRGAWMMVDRAAVAPHALHF